MSQSSIPNLFRPLGNMIKHALWWLLPSLLFFPLSCGIGFMVIVFVGLQLEALRNNRVESWIIIPSGIIGGLTAGIIFAGIGERWWGIRSPFRRQWWILTIGSFIGGVLFVGFSMSLLLTDASLWWLVIFFTCGGAIVGTSQWIVLRRFHDHAVWWIGATASIWGFLVGLYFLIVLALSD